MAALIYSRQRGFERLRVILCIQISKTWSVLRSESVPCMIQHAADGTLDQVEKVVKQALAKFELVSQADTENE